MSGGDRAEPVAGPWLTADVEYGRPEDCPRSVYVVVEYAGHSTRAEINGRPAILPDRRGWRLGDGRDLDPESGEAPQRCAVFETERWSVRR